jgi:integrase/recombinase XerC
MKNFLDEFELYLRRQSKSENTIKAYIADIRQLFAFTQETRLENLNVNEVQSFLNYLRDDLQSSNRTLQRKLNSISTFFNWLIEKKIHKSNPLKDLNYPKRKFSLPKFLTTDQAHALLESSREDFQCYALIQTFLHTGIKLNELLNLQISNIEFGKMNGKIILNDRNIELNDQLFFVLKTYVNDSEIKSKFLFSNGNGNKYDARNLRRKLEKCFKKAGLSEFSINDLRNTFIVNQLKNKVSIDELTLALGNKSKLSTERYLMCLS